MNSRNRKYTIVPMIGPSMVPMPPMTTMKITNAVQSLTLKAASGETRIFCRAMMDPTMAVMPATTT